MQTNSPVRSRKKFLWWGSAALASLALLNFFNRRRTKKETVVKMLTPEGQLVTIDKKLVEHGKKITDKELQEWIKK